MNNMLKLSWKHIWRNGFPSLISILVLSTGMALVALIQFWVVDELNFDRYHAQIDRIYTVYEHQELPSGEALYSHHTPGPLAGYLKEHVAEIEQATRFAMLDEKVRLSWQGQEYLEGPLLCADTSFFKVFTFQLLEGDLNALASPDKIIITGDLARTLFGDEPAMGKQIQLNGAPVTVGAVIAPPGENSTLRFQVLVPSDYSMVYALPQSRWSSNWANTCVLLSPSADVEALSAKIAPLCQEMGQKSTTLHLFPYKNERLYSYSGTNNRVVYVWLFQAIALIILMLSSLTFINYSIVKADKRRLEVGVRKVLGGDKTHIFKLFLEEQGMMILFSLILCIALVLLLFPTLESLSGKTILWEQLPLGHLFLTIVLPILMMLAVSIGYPAMSLSSVAPVTVMKKIPDIRRGKSGLRSMQNLVHFVLSILLIGGSLFLSHQVHFMTHFDLGYDHEGLIYIRLEDYSKYNGSAGYSCDEIQNSFGDIPGIESITFADQIPLWGGNSWWGYEMYADYRSMPSNPLTNLWGGKSSFDYQWEGKDPQDNVLIYKMEVGPNFLKTMGIRLAEGPVGLDSKGPILLLNQEAVRRMGITQPVGKAFIDHFGASSISGIVEDFHFESLHSQIAPLVLYNITDNIPNYIIMRIRPERYAQTIEEIKKRWAEVLPNEKPCDIGSFDDRIAQMYGDEIKIAKMFQYLSILTVLISCLGLFGMVALAMENRTRELCIRIINGARAGNLIWLLNKQYLGYVTLAILVAMPMSWYFMSRWLEFFANKAPLRWWIFALSTLLSLFITLITVSWLSWKGATKNPVDVLQGE